MKSYSLSILGLIKNGLFFIGVLSIIIYYSIRLEYLFILSILCGITLLIYYAQNLKYYYMYIFLFLLVFFYFLKILYYQQVDNIGVLFLFFANVGFSIYLYEEVKALKLFKIIYVFLVVFLIGYFLLGYELYELAEETSGNFVNYNILAFSILLMTLYYKIKSRVIILPAVFSLFISFWSMGRTGIIASLILLIGSVILKYYTKLSRLKFSISLIILPLLLYIFLEYSIGLINDIMYRFGKRSFFIEGEPRLEIWKDYFKQLNFEKVFFGSNFKLNYFAGFTNLHNSYLEAHYLLGVMGVVLIIAMLVALILLIIKKKYFYLLLMFGLLLRGLTDTVMLTSRYDFVLFFLIIIAFNKCKIKDVSYPQIRKQPYTDQV